jgi:hypothetical protein
MTLKLWQWLIVLGLATPAAAAQPRPFEGRSGTLAARLIMVDDLGAFWRAWRGPNPPQIRETNTVTPFKPAHALLIFTGCKAAANGKCNVGVTFTMTGPNQKPYGKPLSGTAYNGPPAKATNLLASPAALTLKITSDERPGPYLIRADVTDRVSGAKVTLRRGVIAGVPRKAPTT